MNNEQNTRIGFNFISEIVSRPFQVLLFIPGEHHSSLKSLIWSDFPQVLPPAECSLFTLPASSAGGKLFLYIFQN